MHWHVLGAGAIGCLFAHALQRSGCQTTLVLRDGRYPQKIPVVVQDQNGRCEILLPAITARGTSPDSSHITAQNTAHNKASISHLLVTTKAFDVRAAVASVMHLLREDCVVLLLVNGMGLAELLAGDWPTLNIYCGTTTEGAFTIATRHVQHAGRGETRIGQQGVAHAPAWFNDWSQAIERCVWDTDITRALWSKLAVNCIINPLTAVHGCRNGELAQRKELATEVAALRDEVAAISIAAGYTDVARTLAATVAAVIAGTADNRSSMLQDVQHGRQTEIDYITGYLLQVAAQHGIAAPHNQALLERIKKYAR